MHHLHLLALFASLAAAKTCNTTSPPKPPNFHTDLVPLLSPNAQVITPNSPHFSEYTHQNMRSNIPDYSVVVAVATKEDVAAAVKYANKKGMPFVAKVSGHGTWSGLGIMKGGMEIWLRGLRKVEIDEEGRRVVVGGGAMVDEVLRVLWEGGWQTATALGQCIGITGSGIGGGLGPLMGVYGLGLDQFVGFRVVLANGTMVNASRDENPDLFWGLKGAGQNFGIIVEATLRIYDRKNSSDWVYRQMLFSGDKVEAVFEAINAKFAEQPGHLSHDVSIYHDGGDSATLDLRIFSNGFTPSHLETYIAPFLALAPNNNSTTITTDLPGLIREMGYDAPEDGCKPPTGYFGSVVGIGVPKHVPSAMRKFYDLFNELTTSVPELAGSNIFIEGYGTKAMREVPPESTAFAHRGVRAWPNIILVYRGVAVNSTLESIIAKWGDKFRDAMLEGQERQESYVNYAFGQESHESLYGYEDWRLKKLRKLKKDVDPKNRFGFFAPIY